MNATMSHDRPTQTTTHEEISRYARELWEKYGRPVGRDEEIWLEAERTMRAPSPAAEAPRVVPAAATSVTLASAAKPKSVSRASKSAAR